MNRKTLLLIWGFGILLAILLDAIGPEHALAAILSGIAAIERGLADALANLAASLAHWVRAFAIALFVVFMVLGIAACRAGQQKAAPLVLAALIFAALAYDFLGADLFAANTRWLLALALSLGGAMAMTRRLLAPISPAPGSPARTSPPPRVGPWPQA